MNILEKLVKAKRMPVLFIGSGIPKRYLYKFPSWDELLQGSFKVINKDPFYYSMNKDELQRQGKSDFEIYKAWGTRIENEFNRAFFERRVKIGTSKNPSWVKRGTSPYKMYIKYRFKNMKMNRNSALKEELNCLSLLKNKISAVITTNYDTFIENYILGNDYTVFKRQHEMFSLNSYNTCELYKIHGSITDADTIIISEKDYDKFDKSRKLFIAKMLTLFSESPIIFLGYSFTDENIRSIVCDFLDCLSPSDLSTIADHFIFITYKKGEKSLIEVSRVISTEDGHNIPITEIQTDNFLEVFNILNSLDVGITPKRIREVKRYVRRIVNNSVLTGDSNNIIMGIDNIPDSLEDKNLAIAIGYKEDIINSLGYTIFPDYLLFEDVLFDNKKFNSKNICLNRYKSISITRLLPVFKYIKDNHEILNENEKLQRYVENRSAYDLIVTKSAQKLIKNIPEYDDINTFKTVLQKYSKNHDYLFKLILKNFNNFKLQEIIDLCKEYYYNFDSENELMKNTFFKRVIMLIDYYSFR